MRPTSPILTCCALALGLAACGTRQGAADRSTANASTILSSLAGGAASGPPAPTLAQGPDVCFRAVAKQLGPSAKISELISFFSAGSALDDMAHEPQGQMTTCTVKYQNPADPRKLLEASMDLRTGGFDPPRPVEITVMGGDEAAFKLDDYLIPLSQVNAAALTGTMKAQEPKLAAYYGKWAWSGVRLEAPDAFHKTNTLRLDVDGRLKTNDIKKGGYASVTPDGKTVVTNFLTN